MISKKNKFLIIDRENIKPDPFIHSQAESSYVLEIVAKGKENLTSGKYLVAESNGKDAADILIILVLHEISQLGKSSITLLTNDHFGRILQDILLSLGK